MIQLTPDQQRIVDAQVAAGQFKDPRDVIDTALRLLAARQAEYDELKIGIEQVERGDYSTADLEAIKCEMNRQLDQRNVEF